MLMCHSDDVYDQKCPTASPSHHRSLSLSLSSWIPLIIDPSHHGSLSQWTPLSANLSRSPPQCVSSPTPTSWLSEHNACPYTYPYRCPCTGRRRHGRHVHGHVYGYVHAHVYRPTRHMGDMYMDMSSVFARLHVYRIPERSRRACDHVTPLPQCH